ncbi:HipA family kinase [Colwellia sp. UCD-KL20]|uniref:HipA family kinase n=1 Tax=Colwellia sp. UCD-KL20 TaxID=1917165 RepID=UPI000970DD19|nr:HipA family kinase [Colwellia sp. UCD-KL20]
MIDIVEIQQQMVQGKTRPWLCVGDDGKQYVVKRLNAGINGCVYEWVAGNLGRIFGLNIPDLVLVNVDECLVEYDSNLQMELGSGIAFASRFQGGLNEVNYGELILANKDRLIELYIFDYWIRNDDRTLTEKGGNPNLYQNLISKELVVFDHNLAFALDFDLAIFKDTHVASFLLKGQADLFQQPINRQKYELRLGEVFAELEGILSAIPQEWKEELQDGAGEFDRLRLILSNFNTDDFWGALL